MEDKRPRVDPDENEEGHVQPMEELKMVQLSNSDPTRVTKIGTRMSPEIAEELLVFLRSSQDVFAWSSKDMVGIELEVAVHELNVSPESTPVKQKRRPLGAEKDKIIEEEVNKLLEVGHIKEVRFPTLLSNASLSKSQKENGGCA
ncbi:PREDICTED: uncharacterized protein LOC105969226 [Erythranthe guttata]|uniref:uncharacterized protein LOC105969226 n=1 Tax=Erythranthe guttata TaxID=4155 RepID=UPI00064DCF36|nr:PREDICTED: uncharacterized protein LOC105969226 [Erythranthe guttata]|eukprot:XP_012849430.1 PREDICTED: uncharacterized protein LOC105969226 [Erythranthe guttata]